MAAGDFGEEWDSDMYVGEAHQHAPTRHGAARIRRQAKLDAADSMSWAWPPSSAGASPPAGAPRYVADNYPGDWGERWDTEPTDPRRKGARISRQATTLDAKQHWADVRRESCGLEPKLDYEYRAAPAHTCCAPHWHA